ncbi:MAG: D-aminoacylase [Gemmatimonadota bacterium]|nr:D-aminoacylase [Gemmatimonadota bacterium]
MKRREFVERSTVLGAGALVGLPGAPFVPRRPRADLVLRNATLVDGTGRAAYEGDVAVTGDRIEAVGRVDGRGSEEIDLRGLVLAPGFVDIHSHADLSLFTNPKAESRIRQGVTLEVTGQDGGSMGPWSAAERTRIRESYGALADFSDVGGFLDAIDRLRPAVNVATMVGQGTIRGHVVGFRDRPANDGEIRLMRQLVREAVAGGAVGLSSGLEYTPGSFAPAEEIAELASELKGTGYPYASHMRNEDDRVLAALEECIQIGLRAGVPVQVSHLKAMGERNWWKADAALDMLRHAGASGVDVHFDRYPYVAYQTGLQNLFPASMRSGGTRAFLDRLVAAGEKEALERAARDKIAMLGSWDAVQIVSANSAKYGNLRGQRLGKAAQAAGVDPYQLTVELLRDNGGSVSMIGFGMSEENTEKLLAHPLGMICSDGGSYAPYGVLSRSSPHPRTYGSFPRVLGYYVRERRALTLESAVRKMTSMPARKLRISERGQLEPGFYADLVAFDPDTVMDGATFEDPHQYPVGIPLVIVNGVITLRDGEHTGSLAGRAVRGAAAAR